MRTSPLSCILRRARYNHLNTARRTNPCLSLNALRTDVVAEVGSQDIHRSARYMHQYTMASIREKHLNTQRQRSFVTITKTSANTSPEVTSEAIQSIVQEASASLSDSDSAQGSNAIQQNNDSIMISASAVQQIHHLANLKRPDNPDQMYLRVYVDAGGCSGFQYKFDLENKDDDEIDEEEDILINCVNSADDVEVLVVIDEASLELLEGSTIDYVREMIRSSFSVVSNPNSESACGCGSSFAVKNFEKSRAVE